MRTFEERLGPAYQDLQRLGRQLSKCPSKVHAEAIEGVDGAQPQPQQTNTHAGAALDAAAADAEKVAWWRRG